MPALETKIYPVVAGRWTDVTPAALATAVAADPDWHGRPVLLLAEGPTPATDVQRVADLLRVNVVTSCSGDWWLTRPRRVGAAPEPRRLRGCYPWPDEPAETWHRLPPSIDDEKSLPMWPVQAEGQDAWTLAQRMATHRGWEGFALMVLGNLAGDWLAEAQLLANYLEATVLVCGSSLWWHNDEVFAMTVRFDHDGKLVLTVPEADAGHWLRVSPRTATSRPPSPPRRIPLARTPASPPRRMQPPANGLSPLWTTCYGSQTEAPDMLPHLIVGRLRTANGVAP